MDKIYCIYHGDNCLDGFTSAWVLNEHFKDTRDIVFIPAKYGQPFPELDEGTDVYIVDFSYPPAVIAEHASRHNKVVLIDHHKSAVDLYTRFLSSGMSLPPNVELNFDLEHSGCGLTWKYFYPDVNIPDVVKYVEDRDLWRFTYGDTTRFFCRALSALSFTFENWNKVNSHPEFVNCLVETGTSLLGDDQKKITWTIEHTLRPFKFSHDYTVLAVNVPKYLVSETNDLLLKTNNCPHGFVIGYHDTHDGRVIRLNSAVGSDVDVSKLAAIYGGGGHKHAASFKVPRDHTLAMA